MEVLPRSKIMGKCTAAFQAIKTYNRQIDKYDPVKLEKKAKIKGEIAGFKNKIADVKEK